MNVRAITLACLLAIGAACLAQEPPGGDSGGAGKGRRNAPELMADNFFAPELIMQNQKALSLTAEQQAAIKAEMQKTMARFTDLQWQQSAAGEALDELIRKERVDEKAAQAQMDKLLAIEDDVKRLHFGMLVRVKNLLTPEQQQKLREMKAQERPGGPPRDHRPGGPGDAPQEGRPRPQPAG